METAKVVNHSVGVKVGVRSLVNLYELSVGLLDKPDLMGVKDELFMIGKANQLTKQMLEDYSGPYENEQMLIRLNLSRAALMLHFIKVVTRISLNHIRYFNDYSKVSACLGFDMMLDIAGPVRKWLEDNPESSEKILTAANFVYGYTKKAGEIFHEAIDQKDLRVN